MSILFVLFISCFYMQENVIYEKVDLLIDSYSNKNYESFLLLFSKSDSAKWNGNSINETEHIFNYFKENLKSFRIEWRSKAINEVAIDTLLFKGVAQYNIVTFDGESTNDAMILNIVFINENNDEWKILTVEEKAQLKN